MQYAMTPFTKLSQHSVLQIRRSIRDNLGIVIHISPLKHICDPILEQPSRQDGDGYNEEIFCDPLLESSLNLEL